MWLWDGSPDNGKCGGGIVLMAFSESHGWFTFYKNVVLFQGIVPWMLKWVDARCSLTNQWMENAPAKSVQLFELLRLRLCLSPLSPPPHNAFFGGMRRTRVDRDRAHPVSFLRVVVARVCDATEARVSVALRVRSYSCPRHNRNKVVWNTISPKLDMDDVIRVRVAAK